MQDSQSAMIQNIAVIGNQHISRAVIKALSASITLKLIVITYWDQEPYLTDQVPKHRVVHKTTDFTRQSLERALQGSDLVISTITAGDACLQRRIIDACVAVGVKRFIANEFGLDSQSTLIQERLPAYKARSEVIKCLRDVENHLEWTAVAVGTILDHELQSGNLGFDLKWHSASIPGPRTTKFPVTSLARVGELVAVLVICWQVVRNRYIYANGCMTNVDEILPLLEVETEAGWVVDSNDPEAMLKSASNMLERGWPDAGWSLTERIVVFDPRMDSAAAFEQESASHSLGLADERVEDIIRGAVHQWQHAIHGDCGCS